jgi:hypothetical protein
MIASKQVYHGWIFDLVSYQKANGFDALFASIDKITD